MTWADRRPASGATTPIIPYACAPYGYWGSDWFYSGVFIGAGPWYRGWYGRPWGYGYGHVGYGWGLGPCRSRRLRISRGLRGRLSRYPGRRGYAGFRGGYAGGRGYAGGARVMPAALVAIAASAAARVFIMDRPTAAACAAALAPGLCRRSSRVRGRSPGLRRRRRRGGAAGGAHGCGGGGFHGGGGGGGFHGGGGGGFHGGGGGHGGGGHR